MTINRKAAVKDLATVKVAGNTEGLIPAFGVFVNQLPASFWNSFAERLTRKIEPDMLEFAEQLLVNAGHECGYHTGYGIINSEEWKAVIGPMVENVEDVLHGAYAVVTAWGWAKAEITELLPGEKKIVRAYDYYEADVVEAGHSTKYSAYMLRGICGAFMDLAYGAPYPDGLYTFTCKQTKGLEVGDDYGEFIVTKKDV